MLYSIQHAIPKLFLNGACVIIITHCNSCEHSSMHNIGNKTPSQAFTPPAEKKIGTKWTFMCTTV